MTRLDAYNTLAASIGRFRGFLKVAGPTVPDAVDVAITNLRLCAEAEQVAATPGLDTDRQAKLRRLAVALADLR